MRLAACSGCTCGVLFDPTLRSTYVLRLRYVNFFLASTVHVHHHDELQDRMHACGYNWIFLLHNGSGVYYHYLQKGVLLELSEIRFDCMAGFSNTMHWTKRWYTQQSPDKDTNFMHHCKYCKYNSSTSNKQWELGSVSSSLLSPTVQVSDTQTPLSNHRVKQELIPRHTEQGGSGLIRMFILLHCTDEAKPGRNSQKGYMQLQFTY